MPQYRKKPVVIDAVQFIAGQLPGGAFLDAGYASGKIQHKEDGCIYIETLEGTHRADPGDYIIRGIKGEYYPCKPDIFEATYDAV